MQVAYDAQKEKCDELSASGQTDTLGFRLGCTPTTPLPESPPPGRMSSTKIASSDNNCEYYNKRAILSQSNIRI